MTILRDSRLNNFRFSMIATNLGACARIKQDNTFPMLAKH